MGIKKAFYFGTNCPEVHHHWVFTKLLFILLQYVFVIFYYGSECIPSFFPVGEECILFHRHWFTPTDFEKFAGKEKSKNWKFSIYCGNTPLKKLIKVNNVDTYRFYSAAYADFLILSLWKIRRIVLFISFKHFKT